LYESRRKNFGINKIDSNIENTMNTNLNNQQLDEVKPKSIEVNENNSTNSTIKLRQHEKSAPELDFDNCNVYLRPRNENQNPSNARKGSAFKFIEDKMKINSNNNLSTTVKPTKDIFTDKIQGGSGTSIPNTIPNNISNNTLNNQPTNLNSHFMQSNSNNITNTNTVNKVPHKNNSNPNIINISASISSSTKNTVNPYNTVNTAQTDKKSEYQSRRKNITNIINELDGKVIDINLNSRANNKSEIDKSDHQYIYGRKNNGLGNNFKTDKDMMLADGNYNRKINQTTNNNLTNGNSNGGNAINNINNTFSQSIVNNTILSNDSSVAINFASRRHINNTNPSSGNNSNLPSSQNILPRHQLNKENNNLNSINSDKIRFY
jgi:hypothetical protein